MELWYPKAKIIKPPMPTHGKYPKGFPEGAIVHYTAGVQDDSAEEIATGRSDGFAYMLIRADGTVYQAHPLDEWGYHAGGSTWPAFPHEVSVHTVGIEIACPGLLRGVAGSYRTWYNDPVKDEQVRVVPHHDNQVAGPYQKYTSEQECALRILLQWLKSNSNGIFQYDFVLGHDEVAPGRKEDPGGSLSMTMPEYRQFLKSQGIS
jgi:N-acetyl-anhydromuramyl-L-alanine amidase AmpD